VRILRAATVVVLFTLGGLLIASPVSADASQLSIGNVTLGPQGATVVVPVTIVCDVGLNIYGVNVTVAQSTGRTLAQAYGYFNIYPGPAACTGAPQTFVVVAYAYGSLAFKKGGAGVTASVSTYDPTTNNGFFSSVGPVDVRISSK